MIEFIAIGIVFLMTTTVIILLKVTEIKRNTENLWTISKLIHGENITTNLILKNQEGDRTDSYKY